MALAISLPDMGCNLTLVLIKFSAKVMSGWFGFDVLPDFNGNLLTKPNDYFAMISSHLTYLAVVWGSIATEFELKRIQTL